MPFGKTSFHQSVSSPSRKTNSLSEQIKVDEERAKLERQIAALERQMNSTKWPRRKRELFVELQKLKSKIL